MKHPIYFNIKDINKHLRSKVKAEKELYLKFLRNEYINLAFNFSDVEIEKYIKKYKYDEKYQRVEYLRQNDFDMTHISHSEYRFLLREINITLLPFVNSQISKTDEQKNDLMYEDFELFDFKIDEILEHSNEVENRILYLNRVAKDYFN